jgi:hypothetical protein
VAGGGQGDGCRLELLDSCPVQVRKVIPALDPASGVRQWSLVVGSADCPAPPEDPSEVNVEVVAVPEVWEAVRAARAAGGFWRISCE